MKMSVLTKYFKNYFWNKKLHKEVFCSLENYYLGFHNPKNVAVFFLRAVFVAISSSIFLESVVNNRHMTSDNRHE